MSTQYKFKCVNCKIDFSVESESKNINDLNKELKRGVRCPKCDDQWGEKGSNIEIQLQVGATRNEYKSLDSKRKENAERSALAGRQAAEFASGHREELVQVSGKPQSKFANAVESIPKSVIDSIANKTPDI